MQKWMEEIINQPVEKLVERMESETFSEDEVLNKSIAVKTDRFNSVISTEMLGAGFLGALIVGLIISLVGGMVVLGVFEALVMFSCFGAGALGVYLDNKNQKKIHASSQAEIREFVKAGGIKKLKEALNLYYNKHGVRFDRVLKDIKIREKRAAKEERLLARLTDEQKARREQKAAERAKRMEEKEQKMLARLTDEQKAKREQKTAELIKKREDRLRKLEEKRLIKSMATKGKKLAKESVAREMLFDSKTYYVDENNSVFLDKDLKTECEDMRFDGQEIYYVETQSVKK